MRTRRPAGIAISIAVVLTLSEGLVSGTAADTVKEALTGGKVDVDARYRYEFVDQDNPATPQNANASTFRLRLGYTTGRYHGLFAMAEFSGTWAIGSQRYNSTANGLTQYPVVADPEGEELNQGFLGYHPLDTMTFKIGRQRIKLDNDRFIGNVGWRQNEQTYDAFSAWFDFSDRFSLFAGYIGNVNRVFGEDNPNPVLADLNLDAPLLNLSYDFPLGKLTGYGYFLEIVDFPTTSQKSIGGRFTGAHAFSDDLSLLYTGEYADQSPYRDGASTNDASYLFAELGIGIKAVKLKGGYELLGGDGTYAFQTPLATGHAFDGWADQFVVTPLAGLEDLYFSASATLKGIGLSGIYHRFAPDAGSGDFATEIDLQISRNFGEMYSVGIKYAGYDADPGTPAIAFPGASLLNVDVVKFWVWLQLHY